MANGYRTLSQHLNDLKKENFSLKLRIYFLEERVQQKGEGSRDDVYRRVSAPAGTGMGQVLLDGISLQCCPFCADRGTQLSVWVRDRSEQWSWGGVCLSLPLTEAGKWDGEGRICPAAGADPCAPLRDGYPTPVPCRVGFTPCPCSITRGDTPCLCLEMRDTPCLSPKMGLSAAGSQHDE